MRSNQVDLKYHTLLVVNATASFFLLNCNLLRIWDYPSFGKETFFTPAAWAFLLQAVIQVFLWCFVIYQLSENGRRMVMDVVAWRFAVLSFIGGVYAILTGRRAYFAALAAASINYLVASNIYYVVKKPRVNETVHDQLWVHLPFSLYHGWASFLLCFTGFQAFGPNPHLVWWANTGAKISVFLCLLFLVSSCALYAFRTPQGDFAACLAIAVPIFAIYTHQRISSFVTNSALGFGLLSFAFALKCAYATCLTQPKVEVLYDEESDVQMRIVNEGGSRNGYLGKRT